MQVLKVVAEGVTTSFRYPHFMQHIHPTYELPPPTTIYGHICSALGDWFDPHGVRFSYHFVHSGRTKDVEHVILLRSGRGRLKGSHFPKVLEGRVNPFQRDLLFQPRLTLYVNRPEWVDAFRSPRYAVVLGRSQDLFTYTNVEVIELQQATRAYFEHTLLPHDMAIQIGRGVTVTMPRFLDYYRNRSPSWERYIVHKDRVLLPDDAPVRFSHIRYGPYWIDPTTPAYKEAHRGVMFLSFIDEEST
ncbi:MAG: CRISPR-associated protein Cas5 [Nitrospirae bacterium]|nr:MAG: CRISPR-associated protein Cas5 [Nitrospirota bacterium]